MYLFIIYSCVKNTNKAMDLYHLISHRLDKKCQCYIVCGIPTMTSLYRIEDKYLYLNCDDGYEQLCKKTMTLCQTIQIAFPDAKGVFKCDDDIIPNISHINQMIDFIDTQNDKIDYLGRKLIIPETVYDAFYYNKIRIKNPHFNDFKYMVFKGIYAAGPLYYISMKSINIISKTKINYDKTAAEDNMVGVILNHHKIFPHNLMTYCDRLTHGKETLHNHTMINKLYILLQDGLETQLFQVAVGYELAKKHNRILVLLYKKDFEPEFMKTVFHSFNYTYYENINLSTVHVYNNEVNSFDYEPNIILDKNDYLLNGYFQNKQYIPNDSEVFSIFKNEAICRNLVSQYALLPDSYFIHVHSNTPNITDKETYYKEAIDCILSIDENPHFFIVSDDIPFCDEFEIFKGINKTMIREMDTLNTFYLMSLCQKGGICADSTFSGWASNLNTNSSKTVIFPKKWIQVGYEIQFDYSIAV